MLHYIHRIDINNVGDMYSGYYKYFYNDLKKYNLYIHDINSPEFNKISKSDSVILGGGGLINCNDIWNSNINTIINLSDNIIFWSPGFNDKNLTTIKINFEQVNLISIRDYNHESHLEYIPCASCMIPYIEKYKNNSIKNIGIISHQNYPIENLNFDYITNNSNIYSIINFIKTKSIIISNSYHAVYWATLMNKKVILYGKLHSNKFNYFKYKPIHYSGNLEKDIDNAKIYTSSLDESIYLTYKYFQKIKIFLKENTKTLYNFPLYSNNAFIYDDFFENNLELEKLKNKIINLENKINYINSEINLYNKNIIYLIEKCNNWIKIFGIFNNKNYIYIYIFGIKFTIKTTEKNINKIAWWIPIRKWRDSFRDKFKIADQTRPDQTRPDQTRPDQTTNI